MVEMILEAIGTDHSPCAGEACCERSSCWKLPGMGCSGARGGVKCVGASVFPVPRKGKCTCNSGACGVDGVCHSPATQKPFRRDYMTPAAADTSLASSATERHSPASSGHPSGRDTAAIWAFGGVAGVLCLALGGVTLGLLRMHRRRGSLAEACMLPLSVDDPAEHHRPCGSSRWERSQPRDGHVRAH